jgi:hypothetical protein
MSILLSFLLKVLDEFFMFLGSNVQLVMSLLSFVMVIFFIFLYFFMVLQSNLFD